MSLPPLDERGFLPDGLYEATIAEIRNTFAQTPYRANLVDSFLEFLDHVYDKTNSQKYLGINRLTPILLSGSFISDKIYPSDIDCVFLIDKAESHERWFWASRLRAHQEVIMSQFNVDFNIQLPSMNNFGNFFSYIGPKEANGKNLNPKDLRGIIKLKQ